MASNTSIQREKSKERIIVEYEQDGNVKAQYGSNLLPELSKRLTTELGRGFSRSNLQKMRNPYLEYPIFQTLSGKLNLSHYCEGDPNA
ncbi:MAG: DUF1016 N-terminal domain-containing protein [Treponema sp.]|nr:DUF1016 N-terminal domain-containing protein [Treponema sp.]